MGSLHRSETSAPHSVIDTPSGHENDTRDLHGEAQSSAEIGPATSTRLDEAEPRPMGTDASTPMVIQTQVTASSESSLNDERGRQPPWKPSILKLGPLAGLGALLFAFLQILASYAILAASNGDAVANWNLQPTVYLAVFTALGNKAMAFAVVQGTIVTFWLRALKGTTLGQLHRDWGYGLYTYKAIVSGRNFNLLALACICATFVAIDGPLLQRATSVRLSVSDQHPLLQVAITPELPSYWSGSSDFDFLPGIEILDFQRHFLPVFYEWADTQPIRVGIAGCPGTCTATVRAPALAVDQCISEVTRRDFLHKMSPAELKLFEQGCNAPSANQTVFGANFMVYNGSTETMSFATVLSDESVAKTCKGNVNITHCSLVSAVAEYDVKITENAITFLEPPSYPNILSRANNTAITTDSIHENGLEMHGPNNDLRTTLSGIANAANIAYYVNEGLIAYPGNKKPGLSPATAKYAFQHITNWAEMDFDDTDCAPAWKDPRDEVMASLNELSFRIGVHTAAKYNEAHLKSLIDDDLDINYNVTGTLISAVEVFHSDFNWFAGAASLELFCIIAILLTYYGWWHLGRHFTFSPLEIAKSFDAPLLQDLASNQNGRGIVKAEGTRSVQYGVWVDEKGLSNNVDPNRDWKLVMANQECVQPPMGHERSFAEYMDLIKSHISQSRKGFHLRRARQ